MDTSQTFPTSIASRGSRKHKADEWESQKLNIERLYVTENLTHQQVVDELQRQYGFVVTAKTLKTHITTWGLDVKNVKGKTMMELARIKARRKQIENKDSHFRVNKKPVDGSKIDRYVRRKNLTEEELYSMPSPMSAPSPAFSVYTAPPSTPSGNQDLLMGPPPSPLRPHNRIFRTPQSQIRVIAPKLGPSSVNAFPEIGGESGQLPSLFALHTSYEQNSELSSDYEVTDVPPPALFVPDSTDNMEVDMGLSLPNHDLDMTMNIETDAQNELIDWAASLPPTPRNILDIGDESDDPDAFDLNVLDRMESNLRHPDPKPPSDYRSPYQYLEDHWRGELEERENKFSMDHPETLSAVRELAIVLLKQGQYVSSENHLRRVALARQKAFGNQHSATLDVFENLAICFGYQGRNLMSERVNRQVLKVRTSELEEDHLATLEGKFGLVTCLQNQIRFEEASGVFRDVLERNQKARGSEHPLTLRAASALLETLTYQGSSPGNFFSVEFKLYHTLKRKLGQDNTDTTNAGKRLSIALSKYGKHKESQEIIVEILERSKTSHGEEHHETLSIDFCLGMLKLYEERYEEAETIFRRLWRIQRKSLGDAHLNTLETGKLLGHSLKSQGRLAEAECVYTEMYNIAKRELGDNNPITLELWLSSASVREAHGKHDEEEVIIQEVLLQKRRLFGDMHPKIFESQGSLSLLLGKQGKHHEAMAIVRDALVKSTNALGEEHRETLGLLRCLACITAMQGHWEEAERIFQEALGKMRNHLGVSHELTNQCAKAFGFYQRLASGPRDNPRLNRPERVVDEPGSEENSETESEDESKHEEGTEIQEENELEVEDLVMIKSSWGE